MTLAIQGPITLDPGPMTLAIRWPHPPGENAGRWPHVPGADRITGGQLTERGLSDNRLLELPIPVQSGDENFAWVTANAGRVIFDALGVGDHMTYESTSGNHCQWRAGYEPSLHAMIDRFLLGKDSTQTGTFHTEATNPPNPKDHYDWTEPQLSGQL